jgi:UDP-N-acetylglucosamine 1-carboxyvinyltransferase
MEKGEQNLTTAALAKLADVLEHKIIEIPNEEDLLVNGGKKLRGEAVTNTSKNGALALICASLLNEKSTILHGVPRIEEVFRIIEIFESLDIKIEWIKQRSLKITPPKKLSFSKIQKESAGKIRSLLMIIGPALHKHKEFMLPHAGGCKMGERSIEAHRHALEDLGASIKTTDKNYALSRGKLRPADITMYEMSDTGTINALLAAAKITGKTIIRFAPPNYQVQDVCFFLEKCGVKIKGIGTSTMEVRGVKKISKQIEHHVSEDPIESMMFLSAAITTGSKLRIKRCPIDFLRLELLKLSMMGLKYDISKNYLSQNKRTQLVDLTVYPSKLKALESKIHAQPYPGINSDNLPFFVPIATQAKGTTNILDWMWENRAIYFTELNRLGADITLADPHRVFIGGPTELKGAQIVCPPALRPSMIILISMLAAEGQSILRSVYPIKRGYEDIVERLNDIGADIKYVS